MCNKWNNILIEWVNCLKLAKPIKNLQELGNGEFFTKLQHIITKNNKNDKDVLTFTFDLIKKHYPKYVIENDPQIHLLDLPVNDLSAITTLLLHYICIYDRKDALTSPMCQSLKRQTQIIIKHFLQLCTNHVTNDDLHRIIDQCCENPEYNSPLLDLLRTPSRLHDKDREISKMRAKLEVEHDEKNDLLLELNKQQQINGKLAEKLKIKSLELSKLRNEVENPNKSLTNHPNHCGNDLERRFKLEIESLEQYIAKLEVELNELRLKSDKLEKLTENLQIESIEWQKKYVESDLNVQRLEKHTNEQEITLNEFRQHCSELESLLDEFRTSKNDSIDDSFRANQRRSLIFKQIDENLAESVIDVQLKELQRECDDLKALLNEKIAKENDFKEKMDDLIVKNQDLVRENQCCCEKIQEINEILQKTTLNYENKFKKQETVITDLENGLKLKEKQFECDLNDFVEKYNDLQVKNNHLLVEQREFNEKIDNLNKLNCKLENNVKKLNEKLENTCAEMNEEKNRCEMKLKELFNDLKMKNAETELFKCKKNDLEKMCNDLMVKHSDLTKENSKYCEKILECNKFIENLENDMEILKKKHEISIKSKENEIDNLNQQLETKINDFNERINDLEMKNSDLTRENANYSKKIQEIAKINEELENKLENLTKITEFSIKSKENEIEVLNQQLKTQTTDFNGKINDLQSKNSDLTRENANYSEKIQEIVKMNEELENKLENLTKNMEISLKSKENEIEVLNQQLEMKISDLNVKINDLQSKNTDLLNQNIKYCQTIEEMKKTNENLEQIKSDLLNKCEELTNSYEKQLKEFTNQILQLTTKNNELLHEHKENFNQMKHLQNDLLNIQQNYNRLEEEYNEKHNACVQFDEYKMEAQQQIDDLTQNIHSMVENYNKLKMDYDSTNVECLRSELGACSEQISADLTKIQYLTTENEQLEQKMNFYKMELEKVKKERNAIIESQTELMKETENNVMKLHEQSKIEKQTLEMDLKRLREAYGHVMSEHSKLELENLQLRKKMEEKSTEINDLQHIKEAYEKLLEENNKYMIEIDTVQHKRSKDREEYVRILKKEREEASAHEQHVMQTIKLEYEEKLDKMKQKMLKMYRDEVDKEMRKMETREKSQLQKTINDLRGELFEAEQKIQLLETNLELKQRQSIRQSRESIQSLQDHRLRHNFCAMNEKRSAASTLPRTTNLNMLEETVTTTTTTRRRSLLSIPPPQNLEMEDEEENCVFNEKYLSDLKDGRCKVQPMLTNTGRESSASRYSELAWRNSMVPAHLKSSYPAETQFVSPSRFKEDDLKSGNIELDDSMCRLLPGEKPRQRKDFGTTSYKRPGPPTPSKNGGRLSLQGNEVHPLREHNHAMVENAKKSTPNRLKDLFRRTATSGRENSENQSTTPKARRLSNIFRKPK